MPYAVLMPVFADRILHGGPSGLGLLMGASGIGALCGGLALASRTGLRGLGRWVALAAAGFGVSLVLFSLSRSFWLSAALLVPVGFCMMVQMASSNTLMQSMVPDALRGRVMAVYSMMFMGMAPFGALFAGLLAERLGAPRDGGDWRRRVHRGFRSLRARAAENPRRGAQRRPRAAGPGGEPVEEAGQPSCRRGAAAGHHRDGRVVRRIGGPTAAWRGGLAWNCS